MPADAQKGNFASVSVLLAVTRNILFFEKKSCKVCLPNVLLRRTGSALEHSDDQLLVVILPHFNV